MGPMQADVLLVGGGVASVRCARTLRRRGFEGSIVLVGDEPRLPYNRPPLSKEALRDDVPDELLGAEPDGWYERQRVTALTGTAVEELDPDAGWALLSDGQRVRFGQCLIATGATPRVLAAPGGERAVTVRTVEDSRALRAAALRATPGGGAVVVGGGLLGVEIAATLAALGLRPTVLERGDALWSGALGNLLSEWAIERLASVGASVNLAAVATDLAAETVAVGDVVLPAGLLVAAIGVGPRDALAARAGLSVAGGVVVDADQRTSHPAVWAAGDVARRDGRIGGHWHGARESGERAALSMLGHDVPRDAPAWTFTEVAGTAVDVFGEAERDASERWVTDSVIERREGGTLAQLVVIGSAIGAASARALVANGASHVEVWRAAASVHG